MSRRPRENSEQGLYHAMLRGIDQRDIFVEDADRRCFLALMPEFLSEYDVTCLAFCLMGNHVHLLVMVNSAKELSLFMKAVAQKYANWHNNKYERLGHLFNNRFTSRPLRDIEDAINVAHYIHNNPVDAGFCKAAHHYRWSSVHTYLHDLFMGGDRRIRLKQLKIRCFEWVHTQWCAGFYRSRLHFMDEMDDYYKRADEHVLDKNRQKLHLDGKRSLSDDQYRGLILDYLKELMLSTQYLEELKGTERLYWLIGKVYAYKPTTFLQLGRVLGHSSGIVRRAVGRCSQTLYYKESKSDSGDAFLT